MRAAERAEQQAANERLTEVEEVSREGVLVQVVVGEVQHFQSRQRPKASGQTAQTVHTRQKHTHESLSSHTRD